MSVNKCITKCHNHPLANIMDVPFNHPNRSEMLLYRTVILYAVYDALKKDCSDAREWLAGGSADFETVADFASLNVSYLKRIIAETCALGKKKLPPYRIWRYFWADLAQRP